jgi:hypothetical protein
VARNLHGCIKITTLNAESAAMRFPAAFIHSRGKLSVTRVCLSAFRERIRRASHERYNSRTRESVTFSRRPMLSQSPSN